MKCGYISHPAVSSCPGEGCKAPWHRPWLRMFAVVWVMVSAPGLSDKPELWENKRRSKGLKVKVLKSLDGISAVEWPCFQGRRMQKSWLALMSDLSRPQWAAVSCSSWMCERPEEVGLPTACWLLKANHSMFWVPQAGTPWKKCSVVVWILQSLVQVLYI